MASPPGPHDFTSLTNSISSSYPSHTTLPPSHPPSNTSHIRRPSENPSIKRRKASMISITSTTSAHPLRQTSFPPESAVFTPGYERSPSVDTMSLVSGSVAGPTKKKRARKSKTGKGDDESTTGSLRQDGGPIAKKRRTSNSASGDEDEDDRGDQTITQMVSGTKEEKQREMEKRAVLVKHMDEQQFRRYEAVRSAKLADATVRRIVNQTLSQSVPATVILAIRSVAKQYIGEVVEGARKVQTQWIEAGEPNSGLPSPPAEDTVMAEEGKEVKKETRRAPLQADHLREAVRRSREGNEGGLAGQSNLWQLQQHSGVERFGTRVRGKRLFK